MSTVTDTRIKCGHCHGYHASIADVRLCANPRPVTPPRSAPVASFGLPRPAYVEPVTQKQLNYINDLGGDTVHAAKLSKDGASHYIEELKRKKRSKPMTSTAPNRQTVKIPQPFLEGLREGYFATRQDSTRPYTFLRVSLPKKGQFKGSLKVQTVHGSGMGVSLKLALVIYDFGTEKQRVYWHNMSIEDDLLLVCVDQRGSALAYAEAMGRCMRCNAELTDDRSRWYSIGPECEGHWPEIIEEVNDTKGPYKPGMGH